MIPIHLRISGFLSYHDRAELDFSTFDLACISGHNGAGKSSLLDAITWALFGEARGKSSDVINLHSNAAEVTLTFTHEENTYRVQRTLPRNKSTVLEFQVKTDDGWRPLTEKTTRDTEARIEQTLRLDYDTFVNASFFLQGKADQFTQQNPSKRKEVLSNILGLEMWEEYKNRSAERRKLIEREVDGIQARIEEIDLELGEEESRKTRLIQLESTLQQLTAARTAQESVLESIKMTVAVLEDQRKLVDTLNASLDRSRSNLFGLETRLSAKEADRDSYAALVNRAKEIENGRRFAKNSKRGIEPLPNSMSMKKTVHLSWNGLPSREPNSNRNWNSCNYRNRSSANSPRPSVAWKRRSNACKVC
jgi:exonuclease SbcC